MKTFLVIALFLACVSVATADLYINSSPGGSNDRCDEATNDRNNANRLFNSQNNAAGGYPIAPQMYFYTGSIMTLQWTNQHACGANANMRCELIWQYSCDATYKDGTPTDPTGQTSTNTCTNTPTQATESSPQVGRHESFQYFSDCNTRNRNTNLFAADQNLASNANSQTTRQNPGGGTNGFECQEERDYYPYWHPTPFVDIAVLTSNVSRCAYYASNSENVLGRNYCTNPAFNNQASCQTGGGTWSQAPSHQQSFPGVGITKPDCIAAPWSRDNHLGSGPAGYMNSYNWTVPIVPAANANACILRLRYNVSSFDYDGWNTDARSNGANSPVQTNPFILMGDMPMRLAVDTTQFGRTFQDRTHTFAVQPPIIGSLTSNLYNVNVRGKRGNIAQVRNCVEYDFNPQNLHAAVGDYIHFQWTGSNFEPSGNAGEGRDGTDRSNFVQMVANDPTANYPEPLTTQSFFTNYDTAYFFTHIGQTGCASLQTLQAREAAGTNTEQQTDNCAKLNALTLGYFNHPPIRLNKSMTWNYMSTRNNDFTNRSQKGHLNIRAFSLQTLIIIASIVGVAAIGGAAGSIYYVAKKNGSGFTGFRSSNSFGSRNSKNAAASSPANAATRSNGSHLSKNSKNSSSKSSFGGSMI